MAFLSGEGKGGLAGDIKKISLCFLVEYWYEIRQHKKWLAGPLKVRFEKCSITGSFLQKLISDVFVVSGPSWVYLKVLPFLSHLLFKIPHPALTQRIDWRQGWPAAHLPSQINGRDVRLPPPLTTSPFSAISGDSHAPIRNRLAVTWRPMATSETGLESIT